MTIKHGKFYKDGIQVPIEHGNKEQIELIDKINAMQSDGFAPSQITVLKKLYVYYQCVCGNNHELASAEMDEDDDPENVISGDSKECSCGLTCEVKFDHEQDGLMLKLKPKK